MKIATWNVNGIRARMEQVVSLIAEEKPDVLCLQEIKARPEASTSLIKTTSLRASALPGIPAERAR